MAGLGSIGATLGSGNEPGGPGSAGMPNQPMGRTPLGGIGAAFNREVPMQLPEAPGAVVQQDPALVQQGPAQTLFEQHAQESYVPQMQDFYQGKVKFGLGTKAFDLEGWNDKWGVKAGDYRIDDNGILTIPVSQAAGSVKGMYGDYVPNIIQQERVELDLQNDPRQSANASGDGQFFAQGGLVNRSYKGGGFIADTPGGDLGAAITWGPAGALLPIINRANNNNKARDLASMSDRKEGDQVNQFAQGGIIEQSIGQPKRATAEGDPVVERAIMALDPESPLSDQQKSMAIQDLQKQYGPEAVEELIAMVDGEMGGQSDGLSDSIPAAVGNEEAALSEGEFVIPADVVSGLGNGSSEAGAKRLEEFMASVRKERTGTAKAAPEINPRQMMGIAGARNG